MINIKTMQYSYNLPSRNIDINSYIIFSNSSYIAIAPCDTAAIKRFLKNKKLNAIFLTHGHWDHLLATAECSAKYNCKVYCSENIIKKLNDSYLNCSQNHNLDLTFDLPKEKLLFISNNDIITIGDINIEVISFQGHSDCSVLYKIENNFFVGDSIFNNRIVHTDLPTSNNALWKKNINNFKSKYKDKKIFIYPAHGHPFLFR